MQRTVRLKLAGETSALDAPLTAFAAACDFLANEVVAVRCRANFLALNSAYYSALRERFGLMSQAAQTAERHVAGTFSMLRTNGHTDRAPRFRTPFLKLLHLKDWRFRDDKLVVSAAGQRLAFDVAGRSEDVGRMLCGELGGATLIKRGANYYLNVCVTLPDTPVAPRTTPIGIDRGINNLLVARAPGKTPLVIKGGKIREYRRRMLNTRQRLQAKGTRPARRVLKRLARKEQRFVLDQARVAAKKAVQYATRTPGAVLVLEDLQGIRHSARARGPDGRRVLHSWAYNVTERMVALKAEEARLPVAHVPAPYTSRTCPNCGDARDGNRRGLVYACANCAYQNHADVVGATNISRLWQSGTLALPRGPVNGPHGWDSHQSTSKPPTSVGGS